MANGVPNGKMQAEEPSPLLAEWQRAERYSSAGAYILTSLAMTSLTKYAASIWRFPGSSILLLVECIATVVALLVQAPKHRPYRPFSAAILRHLPLVTLAKALNMYLSFLAMKRTSLPVYNVLKRLQPVYALLQDWLIRGTTSSGWELGGIAIMCFGSVVTGLGDLDFDLVGYAVALAAAACQSLYLVLARHAQDKVQDLTHLDLLFYTAFYNCIIFLPLSALEFDEVQGFLSREGEVTRLIYFLVPYVILGALLNYTTFWCTAANSPIATAVAGGAKGILSTIIGLIQFGAHLTVFGWLGLVGNTAGGLVYSFAHAFKKRGAKEKAADFAGAPSV
eukprot:CAMPEP_0203908764 /NCGR_PEP_ID=MMETSP0359-20131031/50145_1 /ASSEMBLY_ACC=CAM_ASM_000338 /TAXON_ID=268821 /ORGANISM="Scrippsiella Hangoei, Strain SHTV-5" /LENGTH=335 /DNA_ID=CAMNT_0050833843 /DNA_START=80 /DNA_END=1084 /DNA_ORIENTATION=-